VSVCLSQIPELATAFKCMLQISRCFTAVCNGTFWEVNGTVLPHERSEMRRSFKEPGLQGNIGTVAKSELGSNYVLMWWKSGRVAVLGSVQFMCSAL
jgi:hypothetical protein